MLPQFLYQIKKIPHTNQCFLEYQNGLCGILHHTIRCTYHIMLYSPVQILPTITDPINIFYLHQRWKFILILHPHTTTAAATAG